MSAMKTKVRVDRRKLLEVVQARRRKAEATYKRANDAYPAKVQKWQEECTSRLEVALTKSKAGHIPTNRYGSPEVKFPDKPIKPSEGRELCNLRRMEKTLEIGSEETILLSQEDADWYFGECRL